MSTTTLAQRLAAARAQLGLSQLQAAQLAGVSRRSLQGWEAGRGANSAAAHAAVAALEARASEA